jgi:hypothetical protein
MAALHELLIPDLSQETGFRPRPNTGDETLGLLSKALREYLAMVTKIKRRGGYKGKPPSFRYASAEEMVLFSGTAFQTIITDCDLPPMQRGNCFANAFTLALNDPAYRYYEGWAYMEHGIPTHHAWVVDPNGKVQDPTWLDSVRNPTKPLDPSNRTRSAYYGVHIPLTQQVGWMIFKGTMNIVAFGEMTPREVLEEGLEHFKMFDVLTSPAGQLEGGLDKAKKLCLDAIANQPQWKSDDGIHYYTDAGDTWTMPGAEAC